MPISVPENRTQGAAISGVSRIIKLPVAYAFSVILRVAQGGATYSPVLKCAIIVGGLHAKAPGTSDIHLKNMFLRVLAFKTLNFEAGHGCKARV